MNEDDWALYLGQVEQIHRRRQKDLQAQQSFSLERVEARSEWFHLWVANLYDRLVEQDHLQARLLNIFKGGTHKVKLDLVLSSILCFRSDWDLPGRSMEDITALESNIPRDEDYNLKLSIYAAQLSFLRGSAEPLRQEMWLKLTSLHRGYYNV